MLSVLIPVFEFDVRHFVRDLSAQAVATGKPIEIICLDDASTRDFQQINKEVAALPLVRYIESTVNLGRSAVRNRLALEAIFDNLLFLDCDGKVVANDYIQRYIDEVGDYAVVYGGRVYQEVRPAEPHLNFHWYVGMAREEVEVSKRILDPYKTFMTNNFMVSRMVYERIKMDESVQGYGHEDTLFAMELKREGIEIKHIDNPLEHIGIEDVDVFLEKSANGVRNLAELIKRGKVDNTIKLVRFYQTLAGYGVIGLLAYLVQRFEPRIMNSLKGVAPNLLWFDLWKLAKLHRAMKG